MTSRPGRSDLVWAAALTLLGVAARLAWLERSTGGDWSLFLYPDEPKHYLDAARRIAREGPAYFATARSLWNGPVNPLWILAWGLHAPAVRVANVFLLALMGLLVWDLARREFGRAAGLWALGLCTVHPPFMTFGPTLLTEAPFVFLLVLSVHVLLRSSGWGGALAGGAVAGLATLTRPTLQLWPVLLLVAALVAKWIGERGPGNHLRRRADPRMAAAFLAGYCALVVPWVAKDAILLQRLTVANGLGAVLYLGNDLKKDGDEPVYSGMEFDTLSITAPYTHLDSEGDRRLRERAVAGIREHPAATARLWMEKVARGLVGHPAAYFYPARDLPSAIRQLDGWDLVYALVEPVTTVLAAVLGLASLVRLGAGLTGLVLGSLVAYVTLLHAVTFAIPRLMLPMFPALAVLAGAFAAAAWERVRARSAGMAELAPLLMALAILGAISFWNAGRPVAMVSASYVALFDRLDEQSDFSGWTVTGFARREGGVLVAAEGGPSLSGPMGPVVLAPNQVVFVELSVDPGRGERRRLAPATLAWDSGDGFAPDPTGYFEVRLDGKSHLYRVSPSRSSRWKGTLRGVRIDFPGAAPGAGYRVGRLVVAR